MNKIVLYGVGKRGKGIYDFLISKGLEDYIYAFCDEQASSIVSYKGKRVYLPEQLVGEDIIFVLTISNKEIREQIKEKLNGKKIIEFSDLATMFNMDRVSFNRDFVTFYHVDYMDDYFDKAESSLDVFWNEKSDFKKLFDKLDLTNVIELACGRGRHVQKYIDKAEKITLVDILQKNIDFCRERFAESNKVFYYKNDGYDLHELKSDEYTALFTYDSMVHFELIDIYYYLKDIYRVLKHGGRALFHHSNNCNDYKAGMATVAQGRSFMSKEIFAYLAYRTGFEIIDQRVIDWYGEHKLDCITLVEKREL